MKVINISKRKFKDLNPLFLHKEIINTEAVMYDFSYKNEEKVLAKLKENQKKPRKKSGFMARLEEAQKRQEAMMRERAKQNAKRR